MEKEEKEEEEKEEVVVVVEEDVVVMELQVEGVLGRLWLRWMYLGRLELPHGQTSVVAYRGIERYMTSKRRKWLHRRDGDI